MENIEKIIERTKRDLQDYGLKKKTLFASLILLEEILYLYNNVSKDIFVETKRNEKELYVEIKIIGNNISYTELETQNNVFILDNIINNTNIKINHKYEKNANIIKISIERYVSFIKNIKFVFSYLDKNSNLLFRGYIFNIFSSVSTLFFPWFTGQVIIGYTNNRFLQVVYTCVSLLIVRIIYAISISYAGIYYNKISYHLYGKLQTELVKELFLITDKAIENNGTGSLLTRINNDAKVISEDIAAFFETTSNSMYYIGIFIASLILDPIVFLAEVVTFTILYFFEKNRLYHFNIERRKAITSEDTHSGLLIDIINGISDIKVLNATKYFKQKMNDSAINVANLNEYARTNSIERTRINRIIIYICYCIIMIYLGYSLKMNWMNVPTVIILFNYFSIVSEPFVAVIRNFLDRKKDFSLSCERVINIISGNEFLKELDGEMELNNCEGDIEFKNASLVYGDVIDSGYKAVDNVSFEIEKNKITAIVGKSGSGKSSILKLITMQRECNEGFVTLDGIDIKNIKKESFRKYVTLVSQDPAFFNLSIKENLLFVKPDATMEELRNACEKAYILQDIENTKYGFDTLLNEKGVRFSGGQRQRLAIARTFLKDSKVMIFDEATSAIDNITQKKIMKNIEELKRNHTIIIVAHRLSTIINADKIFVVSNGKIIDSGNHNTLMTKCEEYKNLYNGSF